MLVRKALVGFMCAGWLAACAAGQSAHPTDVTKVFSVKSTFGPEFRVTTKGPSMIDPKITAPQKLPPGVTFDPPDCAKLATAQRLPPGTNGKMAAVAAEGKGNRFIAIAIHSSQKVPFDADAAQTCKHVTFTAGKLSGVVDVVDAPGIDGAQTFGTHRQFQAQVGGKERSGEFDNYVAYLGDSVVMVDASTVPVPNQPPAPVDVERARRLLTDSVSAIRR